MDEQLLEILFNTEIQEEKARFKINAESFKKRVLKIKNNPKTKANFYLGEIACSLFDFDLALKNLTDEEFNNFMDMYEKCIFNTETIKCNYDSFKFYCLFIISLFNSVAPYEKICNFNISNMVESIESYTKIFNSIKDSLYDEEDES